MGVVYLASDGAERQVAIKVLRQGVAADETARRRLAHEVETMRRVSSPYVAEVLDADVTGNPPYIVTRYVPGQTLEDHVAAQGPLAGPALSGLAAGLTAALTAVHAAGVVHRDLKPGNVMLVDGRPVVIDFGIAQAADSTRLTMTGMFMGTPGYLAPEVIEGKQSGPAADIHSWGATLAYAATGRPPFGSGTFEAIFYRIVHGQPDLSGMPAPLVPLVLTALARDPARRPPAADLAAAVARISPAELGPASHPPFAAVGLAPGTTADRSLSPPPGRSVELAGAAVGPTTGPPPPAAFAPGPFGPGPAGGAANGGAANGGAANGGGRNGAGLNDAGLNGAGLNGAGLNGAGPYGAGLNGAGPYGAGPNGGAGAPARPAPAWPLTRPLAVRSKDDFADLLPPVNYAPSAAAASSAGQGRSAGFAPPGAAAPAGGVASSKAGLAGPQSARLPLVLATVAGLIAISVLFPVAGAAAVLIALILLRSADVATAHRARRGSSAAVAAAYFPWAVVRSVVRFVLLAPLALLFAAGAAAIAVLASGTSSLPKAGAWAAGALVACYCLGPGSAACRRPLSRFYGRVTTSGFGAAAGFACLAALAGVAIIAAAALTPGYWPADHLGQQLQTTLHPSFLQQWPASVSRISRQIISWFGQRL
jgi:Protein kinase domain